MINWVFPLVLESIYYFSYQFINLQSQHCLLTFSQRHHNKSTIQFFFIFNNIWFFNYQVNLLCSFTSYIQFRYKIFKCTNSWSISIKRTTIIFRAKSNTINFTQYYDWKLFHCFKIQLMTLRWTWNLNCLPSTQQNLRSNYEY
jgi:hypothetical protein